MRHLKAAVSDPNSFHTAPGSRIHTIYGSRFNGQSISLVIEGQEDIQDQIESYAPFCDINYMLQRLKVGDNSVLSQRAALYGDFSAMPVNPIDAVNLVRNAERRFAQLPTEEKKEYNNDYRVWLASTILGGETVEPAGAPGSGSPAPTVEPAEPEVTE